MKSHLMNWVLYGKNKQYELFLFMSIVSKEGFLFYDDQCIIVEGEKLQIYIAYIKKIKLKILR